MYHHRCVLDGLSLIRVGHYRGTGMRTLTCDVTARHRVKYSSGSEHIQAANNRIKTTPVVVNTDRTSRPVRGRRQSANDTETGSAPSLTRTTAVQPHQDLPSFLRYAKSKGLSNRSTVYIGTHYEYTTMESLARLGFSLERTAGRGDRGVDLVGYWSVPSAPLPLRVLLQCKARSTAITPENVRELEGAFNGAPAGWQGQGVLGILVSTKEASAGVRDALQRSTRPLIYVQIAKDGVALQMIWNANAQGVGLQGITVATRFIERERRGAVTGGAKCDSRRASCTEQSALMIEQEVVLLWNGDFIPKHYQRQDRV